MKKFLWHYTGCAGTNYRATIGCYGQAAIFPTVDEVIETESEAAAREVLCDDPFIRGTNVGIAMRELTQQELLAYDTLRSLPELVGWQTGNERDEAKIIRKNWVRYYVSRRDLAEIEAIKQLTNISFFFRYRDRWDKNKPLIPPSEMAKMVLCK